MFKLVRGILILVGILLIFLLLTACSSGSVFTKKTEWEPKPGEYAEMPERDEFNYDDMSDKRESDYDKRISRIDDGDRYRETGDRYAESGRVKDDYTPYNDKDKAVDSYRERSNYDRYYETGVASWYGREFHGRKTASGERFDMNRLTAAHKKLPFGTKLRVTNLENGSSVNVVVNDRGPYKEGRILDLSYAAARKLGIIASGEGKVGIMILDKAGEDNLAANRDTDFEVMGVGYRKEVREPGNREEYAGDYENREDSYCSFTVQAGAFYSRTYAERFRTRLRELVNHPVSIVKESDMYKVRIGDLRNRSQAAETKRILENEDISSFIMESRN